MGGLLREFRDALDPVDGEGGDAREHLQKRTLNRVPRGCPNVK